MPFPICQAPVLETERQNCRQKDGGNGIETVGYFLEELQNMHPAAAKKFWKYLNLNKSGNDTKKYGNNERGNSTWLGVI